MRFLYNLSRLSLNKTLKKVGAVVSGYIFNTLVNPSATFWKTITNVATDGSKWVFTSGVACTLNTMTGTTFGDTTPIVGTKDIVLDVSMNMPSTSLSGNGISLLGVDSAGNPLNKQIQVATRWDYFVGSYCAGIWNGAWSVINTGIAGGTTISVKLIIKTNGNVEIWVNGTLYNSMAGLFAVGDRVRINSNKYTETTGYIYSGTYQY